MKHNMRLVGVFALVSGGLVYADPGVIGKNSQGIEFFTPQNSYTGVVVMPGAIPGTTLLKQQVRVRKDQQTCIYLVRGMVATQADIDALKPEKLIQMSCTPDRLAVDVQPTN